MRVARYFLGFAFVVLAQLDMNAVEAFNVDTHESMNTNATNASSLNDFLQHDLAFEAGTNQPFKQTKAIDWIAEGGKDEDDGSLLNSRAYRHFHDPLRPWDNAGLQPLPLEPWRFESSIVWMQDDDGGDAGSGSQGWSWPDARRSYYHALTAQNRGDREQKWADTFRAVGQMMHLVEDAASPAHVRNDPHGLEYICRTYFHLSSCGGNFEYWVSDNPGAYNYGGAAPFQAAILDEATNHPEAPVPVAHLIDNDLYLGFDANVTVGTLADGQEVTTAPVGIAEFTNANFFSEDTVGNYWYRFPSLDPDALVPVTLSAPSGILPRQYYAKADGYGYPVSPLVAEGVFDQVVNDTIGWIAPIVRRGYVDENVWRAYATTLVPKAVDYAQGALDYFFRGRIDFVPDPDDPNGYLIKNLGPEDLNGTFELYYDDADGNRQLVPGANQWQLPILAAAHCQNGAVCNQVSVQAFTQPFFPPPNGSYTLVFRGQMGNEADAVAAKVVQGSSFLLVGPNATYQSTFFDRGWQQIGDGLWGCCSAGGSGYYVTPNLLFLNGGLRSVDGGRSFTYVGNMLGDGIYVDYIQPIGGSRLVGIYWTYGAPRWDPWGRPMGLIYSDDLGVTWQIRELVGPDDWTFLFWSVFYVGDNTLYQQRFVSGQPAAYWWEVPYFASSDSGATWSAVGPMTVDGRSLTACDGTYPDGCGGVSLDFAWNQLDGVQRVILGVGETAEVESLEILSKSGVFKSNDGRTWRQVYSDDRLNGCNWAPEPDSVAINPVGEALLVTPIFDTCGPTSYHRVLMKSTDGGDTWQEANVPQGFADSVPSFTVVYMGRALPAP